jgi:D-xylose transport system substrate-binding protein
MFSTGARRLAGGLAALIAAAGIAACGSSSDSSSSSSGGSGAKIALLLPESKTTRYEKQDKPLFEQKVKDLCPDCEVLYSNAEQDPAKQQQQAEAAITDGAKVLVLDAVDVKSAAAIAQRAKQQGVKVVSYGRLVADAPLDYYVSIDPFDVGVQQGEALMSALKKKGVSNPRIIMINGAPTDSNAKPYKDGALSVFKKQGATVVKTYDTPDWSPDKAQTEAQQAVTALGKTGFDAVYVANDGMATGAVAALKSANIDPSSKPVTGQDAEVTGVQRLLTCDQLMTVYQPIPKIAATAAELAVPLAQGKTPPSDLTPSKVDNGAQKVPSALLKTLVITKNNIKGTVVADGFLTTKQICTGAYKKACQASDLE